MGVFRYLRSCRITAHAFFSGEFCLVLYNLADVYSSYTQTVISIHWLYTVNALLDSIGGKQKRHFFNIFYEYQIGLNHSEKVAE